MRIDQVNNALGHRIVSGSDYQWKCYGPNARYLDYESKYAYGSALYDTETFEVYEATINDVDDNYQYRWMNPKTKEAHNDEAKSRGLDPAQAWDDVKWCDLEIDTDWLEKAQAIFEGKSFDRRIQVPIELENSELLNLALEAHKRDITLNKMVEILLQEVIDHRLSTDK